MKTLMVLVITLFSMNLWAEVSTRPEAFICNEQKQTAVYTVETKQGATLGICGSYKKEMQSYLDFEVFQFSNKNKSGKALFTSSADSFYIALKTANGLSLIERIKIDKQYVETFKHSLVCDKDFCKLQKPACIQFSKAIFEKVKDKQLKARLKEAGCLKS